MSTNVWRYSKFLNQYGSWDEGGSDDMSWAWVTGDSDDVIRYQCSIIILGDKNLEGNDGSSPFIFGYYDHQVNSGLYVYQYRSIWLIFHLNSEKTLHAC